MRDSTRGEKEKEFIILMRGMFSITRFMKFNDRVLEGIKFT